MPGHTQGLVATVSTGVVFLAVLYWLLKYNQAAFTIGTGAATNFGKFARTAQGA